MDVITGGPLILGLFKEPLCTGCCDLTLLVGGTANWSHDKANLVLGGG